MSDDPFMDLAFDGILGLGLKELSVTENFNLFSHFLNQTDLTSYYIDASLKRLIFLSIRQQSSLKLVSNNNGYWTVNLEDVIINGVSKLSDIRMKALLDTGSSFITLNDKAYNEVIKQKFANHGYCDQPD